MVIISNFHAFPPEWQAIGGERGTSRQATTAAEFLRQARNCPEAVMVVNCNPRLTFELGLAKLLGRLGKTPIVSVDLVLRAPRTPVQKALLAVKIATHEVDTHIDTMTGKVYYIPRSIAFENMDEDAFVRFFNRATFIACERWLKGMKYDELRDELYRLIDGEERASLGNRI